MRKLLILPALLLICSISIAGENDMQNSVTSNPTLPIFFPRFNSGIGSGNAAPATQLRLIAKANSIYKNNGFQQLDSTTYSYSQNRGSVLNPDDMDNDEHMLFDASVNYSYNTALGSYEYVQQREQQFKNNNVDILIYRDWDINDNVWENSKKYEYYYDKDGKMQASKMRRWYAGSWSQDMNSYIKYDNSNNVVEMNSLDHTVDFFYDSKNNLITVVDDTWNVSTGWTKNERKNYSYSSSNNVTEYILEKWDGNANAWRYKERTEYQYDANDNVTIMTHYNWVNGTWQYDNQHNYVYDAKNNMLEDVTYIWQPSVSIFTELSREVRTYNSQSLVEALVTYSWGGSNWVHKTDDIQVRYYYEHYNPSSVPTFNLISQVEVYPIPARDKVTLNVNMNSIERCTISVFDLSGREVYHAEKAPARNATEVIPVHNLASGNYLISVNTSSEKLTQKLIVSH